MVGQEYAQRYSAVNEKGERYVDAEHIEIAYANGEPGKGGALHVLDRQASLGGLIKRIFVGGAILAVLSLFFYAWSMPRERTDAAPVAG